MEVVVLRDPGVAAGRPNCLQITRRRNIRAAGHEYIVGLGTGQASTNGPRPRSTGAPAIALLPWGDAFLDFLDRLGISFEAFRDEFTGSWMFGYAAALRTAGVETVIVWPSAKLREPLRGVHRPTGARLVLLPTGRAFGFLRAHALPDRLGGRRDPASVGRAVAAHIGPYLGTPPFELARTLRHESCRAVLCQEYETPRFDVAVALGRTLGIPTFATFQGGDYQMSRIERVVRPLALGACAGVVVGPEAEAERIRHRYRVSSDKVARIFNPVDVALWRPEDRSEARRSLGLAPDAEVVAWHGQVQVWRKGLDILLEAWETLGAASGRERVLLLVGSGEDAAEVRRWAEAGRPAGVRFLEGWMHDRASLRRVLSAADVYAFPSRHEGFPVAPIEAMACGLPVVAADAQGVADLVGDCGVVVSREDASALAAAIAGLLAEPERRRRLGEAARRRIETRFSLEVVGAQLRAFLEQRRPGLLRP
jgi:starch synthase